MKRPETHEVEGRHPYRVGVLDLSKLEAGDFVEKSAVTLWDLRRRTSPFSKKYVPGCNARLLRTEAKRGRWLFRVTCSKPDSKPTGHIVRVRILKGKGRKMVTRDVQVSCSCGAWKYWGADFNAAGGEYLEGTPRSDGSAPDVRDPRRSYLICKHVYTVGFIVREWAVPYEFEGEVQYRFKERRKKEPEVPVIPEEVEEVEPGVPEVRRPERPPEKPPEEEQLLPERPPVAPEEPEVPPEEVTPEEIEEEEEEDFPVYLL